MNSDGQSTNSLESLSIFESMPTRKIHLFGVFDGHGSEGKQISEFVKRRIPLTVKKMFSKFSSETIPEILHRSILKVDSDLEKSKIKSKNSGTTCCLALVRDTVRSKDLTT